MRILVTGSSGHLGEALVRTLRESPHDVIGLDLLASPFTDRVGSIVDRETVRQCLRGIDVVLHAATLHKPHVVTHTRQAFVDINITGTLNLLEEAVAAGVGAFVFTSTTSVFGRALVPPPGEPAAWIDEDVQPIAKNIYGASKAAAEDLCRLFHRDHGLPCIVLRTSRFFPEADDDPAVRAEYADDNVKVNEYLHRRADLEDVVAAHLLAIERTKDIGHGTYIVSATTPFEPADLQQLRVDAPSVVRRLAPEYEAAYAARGWTMFPTFDRVYDNRRAREELGWRPKYDFAYVVGCLNRNEDFRSPLARAVGAKGYHQRSIAEGPYPV
jgi:nucleoside-diphosphate-sugar epimerase